MDSIIAQIAQTIRKRSLLKIAHCNFSSQGLIKVLGGNKEKQGAFGEIWEKLAGCFQSFSLTIQVKVGSLAIRMVLFRLCYTSTNTVESIRLKF